MTAYWAPHAWLPSGVADDVRISVSDGRITAVGTGVPASGTT